MKFTAREDIEAPIRDVWAVVTDFDMFETAALRRGAQVQRQDKDGSPAWAAVFPFRGKERRVTIRLVRAEAPGQLGFAALGKALEGDVAIELVELSPQRTRMAVSSEMRPRTLAARLFVQSLKLARGRLTKRYQQGIAQLSNMIEARIKGHRGGF